MSDPGRSGPKVPGSPRFKPRALSEAKDKSSREKENKMNIENFETWIKDLESGEFEQFDGALFGQYPGGVPAYCCLGVGCLRLDSLPLDDPLRVDWHNMALAPEQFIKWLDLPVMKYRTDEVTGDGEWVDATWKEMDDEQPYDIGLDPNRDSGATAASMNDEGKSFAVIAKWLREHRDNLVAFVP